MAAMAAPHQPRYNLEDPGYEPRTARDAREAARAARNGQSPRYRRTQSPDQLDDYRFQSEESDMRSPTSDVALQDAMIAQAQQQQQRVVPVGQVPRNAGQRRQPPGPNTNNINGPRGPQGQPMPPSYPGGPNGPMDNGPQQPNGPREGGRYRRQQSRRTSESEQARQAHGDSPQRAGPNTQQSRVSQSMASEQHQQRRAPSPDRLAVPGGDINRLNSPSIQKSVLQPLEQKIQEYDHLMHEAQSQMTQLDEELRALQERRRQAEDRFIEAKSKHDEYERQHQDVGKALRGELPVNQPPPPAVRQPMQRMESMDSFDQRPVSAQSSFHQKPKKGGMLRMSLFNKSS